LVGGSSLFKSISRRLLKKRHDRQEDASIRCDLTTNSSSSTEESALDQTTHTVDDTTTLFPGDKQSSKVRFQATKHGQVYTTMHQYECQNRKDMYWPLQELVGMLQDARILGRNLGLQPSSEYVESLRFLYKDPATVASRECNADETLHAVQLVVQHEGRGLEKLACPQIKAHRSFTIRAILTTFDSPQALQNLDSICVILNQRAIDFALLIAKGDAAEAQGGWDQLAQDIRASYNEQTYESKSTSTILSAPPVSEDVSTSNSTTPNAFAVENKAMNPNESGSVSGLCRQFGSTVYQGLSFRSVSALWSNSKESDEDGAS